MSLNKTPIEWTDMTWNPVTGCYGPGGTSEKFNCCPYCYCYAHNRTALRTERFRDKALKEGRAEVLCDIDRGHFFAPTFYPYRLAEPCKIRSPKKIFVVSMGDLFGDWVPAPWIRKVLDVAEKCPQHTFMFLTKNPKRYLDFIYPRNCWLGATATNKKQWEAAVRVFWDLGLRSPDLRRIHFVSCEPLLEQVLGPSMTGKYEVIDWLIIGGLSGSKEERKAVNKNNARTLIAWAKRYNIPVFVKNNLYYPLRIQKFPKYKKVA